MKREDFLHQSQPDLTMRLESGTVVSSRIRLARNLRDHSFPGWATEDERLGIWEKLSDVLPSLDSMKSSLVMPMDELDGLDKQVLLERHLISREQCEKGTGSGLVVREDQTLAIMVNEEDHLRMQALRSGLDLREAWETLNKADSELEEHVRFAFSAKLGYLTACPTNVGTGLRASVMLHLPALTLMNEINPIIKGMGKIGLAVRGLWGEGTEATGNLFQISNQVTLGDREENIIENLEKIVLQIVENERNATLRLLEHKENVVKDHVGRAFGILSNAHILTSKEALDLLSSLSLGAKLGIMNQVGQKVIDELLLLTQPAHLQKIAGKPLKPKERDCARAEIVRQRLGSASGSNSSEVKR